MSFVPNHGQMPQDMSYGAQGLGYSLGLSPAEVLFAFSRRGAATSTDRDSPDLLGSRGWSAPTAHEQALVRMQLLGADPAARPATGVPLPGKANFLIGDDPAGWRTGIPTYGKVTYKSVYPGVDASYHGNQDQLEYDFVVAPGADPSVVGLGFAGVQGVRIDGGGELVLRVAGGELRHHAPVIYQDGVSGRTPVAGGFVIRGDGSVGFTVGAYDRTRPLVIDPTLAYSTYLGGVGFDSGLSIAVDYVGQAYVAGATSSPNFPTTPGAFDTTFNGFPLDAYVAKLNASGSALLYSTFLGGNNRDDADAIAVDLRGNAYVRGVAQSPDFPTTPGAFDTSFNGSIDAYVAKLSPNGSLVYLTFLGGAGFDSGSGIAVDRRGAAYVAGITGSPEFPTTPGAFDTTFHGVLSPMPPPFGPGDFDAYLTKVAPDGSRLEYSTLFGASRLEVGFEVEINLLGEAYVTGLSSSPDFPTTPGAYDRTLGGPFDPYVAKFNRDGSALLYSTFVGGSGPEGALGLAVDLWGSAYITGETTSPDFPTTLGAFDRTYGGEGDVFVTKLAPDGSALAYSTFLGGGGHDGSSAVAVNYLGEAHVVGFTGSTDFPTTPDALSNSRNGGSDAFLTRLNARGTGLGYSTYLGGSGHDSAQDVIVDLRGAAYVSGTTQSPDFPTTVGAFDRTVNSASDDAFVSKISRP
ncbi:MAG TPA: hypothetical protein VHH09_07940 [Acidimicrobiales bacterium]|nr:hypothetical protein [Acidimicrobiales bacterium]